MQQSAMPHIVNMLRDSLPSMPIVYPRPPENENLNLRAKKRKNLRCWSSREASDISMQVVTLHEIFQHLVMNACRRAHFTRGRKSLRKKKKMNE